MGLTRYDKLYCMKLGIPDISSEVQKEDIFNVLQNKYSTLGPLWVNHQMQWMNGIYGTFKDHDKFLIIIYLIKKTLDFYSRNFVKLTFDEYYSQDTVEVAKFNISEISTALNMAKESTRRKIIDLEKMGAIKRVKNKILIDRSSFNYSKPINSIKRISRFLAVLSDMSIDEKILPRRIASEELEVFIKKNFSYVWKLYYELQIPMMLRYKTFFGNHEAFQIFSTCVVNQHLYLKKINNVKFTHRDKFIQTLLTEEKMQGLNAMSISDITGIPRATAIRKLQILVEKNFLNIDKKKHYKISGNFLKTLSESQIIVLDRLSDFSSRVYNLAK
jgi:predicted transcriptional regulator